MEPSGVTMSPGLRRVTALLGAAAMLAWACGGPAAPPNPTGPPAATGQTGARATAAASSRPSPSNAPATAAPVATPIPAAFSILGDGPVIERGFVPNRGAVLPGAVAVDNGTFHAWVIAFASTSGTQEIHHLVSPDARTWIEAPDASLAGLSTGLGNPGALPTTVLRDGDRWVMYLTGTLATEREGWEIWRATAQRTDGPWTRDKAPVLHRGPTGAWDSGGLDFPTVLRTDDGYVLLYSGIDVEHRERGSIGRATSADGIEWTKDDHPATTDTVLAESDPVAAPGLCGGFDTRAIYQPRVVVDGERWVMAFAGYAGPLDAPATLGLAESLDEGRTWRCLGPGLDTTGLPEGFIHTLTAFRRGDRLALLIEWFRNAGTDIWLAEAPSQP